MYFGKSYILDHLIDDTWHYLLFVKLLPRNHSQPNPALDTFVDYVLIKAFWPPFDIL